MEVNNRPRMLLVTDAFPFGQGESFLETELPYLASCFDLSIVSSAPTKEQSRTIPAGVRLYHYVPAIGFARCSALVRGSLRFALSRVAQGELADILRAGSSLRVRAMAALRFFIASEQFYDWLRASGLLIQGEPVICYFYWSNSKLLGLLRRKRKHPQVKVISRLHGYDLYKERAPGNWQPFKRFMDRKLDQVHFVSEFGLRYYMDAYGIAQGPKHILSRLGTVNETGMGPYKKGEVLHIVSCSNVVPLKRIELIIDALALVEYVRIDWQHFGGGIALQNVQSYAQSKLGKNDYVNYHFHGAVPNHAVLAYYATHQVDCFITTSATEGGNPVSITEALSFGIPVIAASVGGITEMFFENCGRLMSPNPTPREVYESIQWLHCLDDASVLAIRMASRGIWESRYMASGCYPQFVVHLQRCARS